MVFSCRSLMSWFMLEQGLTSVALTASLWTSLSHSVLHSLISGQPSSCPSFPFFPGPLTVHLPGTSRLGPTPHRLVTHAVYPPTSHSGGFHASVCYLQCSSRLPLLPHLETKSQVFSLRLNQDGTSPVKPSQNYSAPSLLWGKRFLLLGSHYFNSQHAAYLSPSLLWGLPGSELSYSTYTSTSWHRNPQ